MRPSGKMLKKVMPLLIGILLAVSLVPGCGPEERIAPIDLVPQDATTIMMIDLGKMLSDDGLTGLFSALPLGPDDPQSFDEAMQELNEDLGIDLRDFDEIFWFSEELTDIATPAAALDGFDGELFEDIPIEMQTVIVTGSFKREGFVATMEEVLEEVLSPAEYKGYEMYTGPGEEFAVAFLSTTTLAMGIPDMVRSVIDVKLGDEPPLSGRLLEKYEALGDAFVKSAAIAPPRASEDVLREAPGLLPIPLDLNALTDIDMSSMTFIREGDSLKLTAETCFNNMEAVDTMEALFAAIKLLPLMMPFMEEGEPEDSPLPEGAAELLLLLMGHIDTESADNCFTFTIELTLTEIEDMIQQASEIESVADSPGEVY